MATATGQIPVSKTARNVIMQSTLFAAFPTGGAAQHGIVFTACAAENGKIPRGAVNSLGKTVNKSEIPHFVVLR